MSAPFTLQIPTYQCHKRVQALRIKAVVPNPRGMELHFEDERFCPIEMPFTWTGKHLPVAGGYFVVYEDGYQSFSPAAAFEAGYTLVEEAGQVGPATQAAVAADLARYGIDAPGETHEVVDEAAEMRRAEWHAEMRADAFGHPHE